MYILNRNLFWYLIMLVGEGTVRSYLQEEVDLMSGNIRSVNRVTSLADI